MELKRSVADLKKRVRELEQANKRLVASQAKAQGKEPEESGTRRMWITAEGIKSLRNKLGLTQAEFGELAGVSSQAVYQWESKEGKLNVRAATLQAIADIKGLGKREAWKRLEG
jgi:DNA-binding transcriptional regulator YiaG